MVTPRPSLRYDHVIFDLDGTLIDSLADLTLALNHALRDLGLPALRSDTVAGYVGEGARALVQRALGAAHANRFEIALRLFMDAYSAHLLDHTQLYAGVPAMLRALAARQVTLSVLSNKPAAMSRTILNGLGVLSCFATVVGGDSLATRKPDPAGVEHLRAASGTSADRLLIVGDSDIDARTAVAAGVAFCGVTWGFAAPTLGTARRIAQPHELIAVVERG